VVDSQNRHNGNAGEPNGNRYLGLSIGDASAGVGTRGITPGKVRRVYVENPAIQYIFGRKIVRSDIQNIVLKHFLTTVFPHVLPRNAPWR